MTVSLVEGRHGKPNKGDERVKRILFLMLTAMLAIGLMVPIAAPVAAATAHTDTYVSSPITKTAGYVNANTLVDPLDPTLYSGAGAWSNAVAVTLFPVTPPWVWVDPSTDTAFSESGAVWVSSAGTTEDGNGDQLRLFKAEFIIPTGAYAISASVMAVTADNAFTIYFGGNQIGTAGNVYGPAPQVPLVFTSVYGSYSFNPTAGLNTLYFVVRNWVADCYNPTGLLYKVRVQYQLPTPTVVIQAKDQSNNALTVPIDWLKTGGLPPNSGTGTVTTFNIGDAGGDVTLTAPLIYSNGLLFHAFTQWYVGGTAQTWGQRTITISNVTSDKTATARYFKITSLGQWDPLVEFNQVGFNHSPKVRIAGPGIAGITVNFAMEVPPPTQPGPPVAPNPGPNDIQLGTGTTDAQGWASLDPAYHSDTARIDSIYAYIDVNGNCKWDSGEPLSSLAARKYWLENFVTGGGHIKGAKGKPAWNFSGNVGIIGDDIVGEFQIVDHAKNISYNCDNNFTFLYFTGDSTNSRRNTASFTGYFTNNGDGSTVQLTIAVRDLGEPGKDTDSISIRTGSGGVIGEIWIGTLNPDWPHAGPPVIPVTIDGGNFQIHNIK